MGLPARFSLIRITEAVGAKDGTIVPAGTLANVIGPGQHPGSINVRVIDGPEVRNLVPVQYEQENSE